MRTGVLYSKPFLIKSREMAITFIPGFKVSPHAVIFGFPAPVWDLTELYAEAETDKESHTSKGTSALLEEKSQLDIPAEK